MDEPELTAEEEQRLRRALALIGAEAGHRPVVPRRRRPVLAAALATAAALSLAVVTATTRTGGESTTSDGSGRGLTLAQDIACSALIADGDVLDVRPAPEPDRLIVDFAVREWILPAQGGEQVRLNVLDPAIVDPEDPLRAGDHVLLTVYALRHDMPSVIRGERAQRHRAVLEETLPVAADTACPDFWIHKDDHDEPLRDSDVR